MPIQIGINMMPILKRFFLSLFLVTALPVNKVLRFGQHIEIHDTDPDRQDPDPAK
jgi:hypothetical protein